MPRNDVADELNVLASSALRGIGKKKKSTMPKKKVSVKVISSKKRLVKGARVGGLVTSIGSKTKTGHATAEIKCPKKKVAQSKTGIYDRTVAWQEKQFAKREESAALQKRPHALNIRWIGPAHHSSFNELGELLRCKANPC